MQTFDATFADLEEQHKIPIQIILVICSQFRRNSLHVELDEKLVFTNEQNMWNRTKRTLFVSTPFFSFLFVVQHGTVASPKEKEKAKQITLREETRKIADYVCKFVLSHWRIMDRRFEFQKAFKHINRQKKSLGACTFKEPESIYSNKEPRCNWIFVPFMLNISHRLQLICALFVTVFWLVCNNKDYRFIYTSAKYMLLQIGTFFHFHVLIWFFIMIHFQSVRSFPLSILKLNFLYWKKKHSRTQSLSPFLTIVCKTLLTLR